MFDNILDAALSKWLQHTPSDSDHIVISSRIRLARNFRDTLFTNKHDGAALHHVDSNYGGGPEFNRCFSPCRTH